MVHEITMPRLSDSMEEGTVLAWLKADGDLVREGEELIEIETDKATVTYDSDQEGTLRIVAGEGESVPIGAVIARLESGRDDGSPVPASTADSSSDATPMGEGRVKASPLARRLASQHGVDLSTLVGTGSGGRIVREDVEAAMGAPPDAAAGNGPTEITTAKGAVTIEQATGTQRTVARRMAESRATVPSFELRVEIDMERCADLREQLISLQAGPTPSYNDIVVRASALALRQHPRVNAAYQDGHFELYQRINIGIAVAAPGALLVPTIFDADRKPLDAIAVEARALAERVRSREITPPELSGATFTISNLGAYGVDDFAAVINPPQAAILALGTITSRSVARGSAVVARRTMVATLTCDHRILYGADGAQFLASVRELLERPVVLLT